MNIYKTFLYKLRLVAFSTVYIVLHENVVPKMKHYLKLLTHIKFDEGSYNTYYEEIKKIVVSFNLHWTIVMDETIKEADAYMNFTTKEELIDLTEKTINMYYAVQTDFGKHFLPTTTDTEKSCYDEIMEKFYNHIQGLYDFKENLNRLDKPDKVENFAKEHFLIAQKQKNYIFEFTGNYIASYLAENRDKILISLEENFKRVSHNVHTVRAQNAADIRNLRDSLYEKNKEYVTLLRDERRRSVDIEEVKRSMALIKKDMSSNKCPMPINPLWDEYHFWETRLQEFSLIKNTLDRLQVEEDKMMETQKLYLSKKTDIPRNKLKCWENMEKKISEHLDRLKELKLNASKAILTFFSVRGIDRVFYSDTIGTYYVDEYGHQVYFADYGLSMFHIDCAGKFIQIHPEDKYYYDNYGRYVVSDDGEKIYKAAPCSSSYKLDNGFFVKHSKDCGHSDSVQKNCHREIKDPNDKVYLPQIDPVDMKAISNKETKEYLWSNLGHVLSEALHDVAELQPKNPIHCLAHKLLYYKYQRTTKEMKEIKQEAETYKNNILRDSKQKMVAAYKAWKEKQGKCHTPGEPDDIDTYAFALYADQQNMFSTWVY